MEYQLPDRMSYKRFCGLCDTTNIPGRSTVWVFESRIGELGARALFDGVSAQLLKKGFIACGALTPRWCLRPSGTTAAARKIGSNKAHCLLTGQLQSADRRTRMRVGQRNTARAGYKLSINAEKKYKLIRRFKADTARTHDTARFEDIVDPWSTSRNVYADRAYPS
jgi:IS5 family transposase